MSKVKLNLIAAACENMGIGINGTLPWNLKNEMRFFTRKTSTASPNKMNAVIMGRKTWDSIVDKYRPLEGRVNIVLTRHVAVIKETVPEDVIVVEGLDEAISYIESREDIDKTWVIGGSEIYKAAMEHKNCDKIYLTKIEKTFACDTFFPEIDRKLFHLIEEDDVPNDKQTEAGLNYYYTIHQKL